MIILDYIEVNQPIGTFYLCSIPARTLLKMVNVIRRKDRDDGVQRELSGSRIKSIRDYCSDPDAIFPTPIVISVNKGEKVKIDETKRKISVDDDAGVIGDVIDGQHRLWGIEYSNYEDEFMLPVVMMFDLTIEQKAYVFSTINSNQVKVDPSLIYDLFEVAKERSPKKTVHQIARVMNNSENSPFYNRLKMLGKKENDQQNATLSQGTFANSLLQLISRDPDGDARRIKRKEQLESDTKYPLRDYFIDDKDEVITKILMNCFGALKAIFPDEWENPKAYILWKTTGFRAVIYALPHLIEKGLRDKDLTMKYFLRCFTAFKHKLKMEGVMLTSDDFPGGGEQNQKKLAKMIIDAVVKLEEPCVSDMIHSESFEDFMEKCGELNYHEIYDLAQALEGHTNSLVFFEAQKNEGGELEIIYPNNAVSIVLEKEQAVDSLRLLEAEYMDGLDAESWYGFRQAMEKS